MTLVHIIAVIFVLALLIAFHEFGHFICAKKLGVPVKIYSIGFPLGNKPLFSYKWGETDCQLNPLPLGGFCAFMDDQNTEEGEAFEPGDKRFLKNRKIWERAIIISGGVLANTLIAYLIFVGLVFTTGVPSQESAGVAVGEIFAGSPAEKAKFQVGDVIMKIKGQAIHTPTQMQEAIKANQNKPVEVVVKRQKQELTLTPTPSEKGTIGVKIGTLSQKRPIQNVLEPFVYGAIDLKNMFLVLLKALWDLVRGALPVHQIGGLVEVVHIGSQVSKMGLSQLLFFAALISVELAILNILPIPALDGGHLFLLIIEALRGKPLPRRIEESLHYAGFVLLLGLGIILIFKDIWGLTLGKG